MISLTKIFRFESAHAIHQYPGSCAQIHGHSYELHVTVTAKEDSGDFIPGLGIVIDFKDLKSIVQNGVIRLFDHKLVLSKAYLGETNLNFSKEELIVFEFEPTAENLLLFFRENISARLPEQIKLASLKLWETQDSFAEWSAG